MENITALTEERIGTLVDKFYQRVRADDRLGPIFEAAIADWDVHLRIMRDFWSGALLRTQRYRGCVMSPHFRLPIAEADFDRWLALFGAVATEVLPQEAAEHAILVGQMVTKMLRQAATQAPGATA